MGTGHPREGVQQMLSELFLVAARHELQTAKPT